MAEQGLANRGHLRLPWPSFLAWLVKGGTKGPVWDIILLLGRKILAYLSQKRVQQSTCSFSLLKGDLFPLESASSAGPAECLLIVANEELGAVVFRGCWVQPGRDISVGREP